MNGIGPIGESMGVGRLGQSDATAPQTGEEKGPSKKKVDHGEEWVAPSGYLTCDNGSDPILGPPYPPSFYQAFAYANQAPRIRWTIPSVLIEVDSTTVIGDDVEHHITINNYAYPTWSAVTPYIQNSRVTGSDTARYYALQDSTNKDPISELAYWNEDTTVFTLWYLDQYPLSDFYNIWVEIGDSTITVPPHTAVWYWNASGGIPAMSFACLLTGPNDPPRNKAFRVTATFQGVTLTSNVFWLSN